MEKDMEDDAENISENNTEDNMKTNAGSGISTDTVIQVNAHSSQQEEDTLIDQAAIAPIIIEELDETVLNSMNVDMTEFVEAKALKVQEISETDISDLSIKDQEVSAIETGVEQDDQYITLTADEEDKLTKQFLNGELTFSEYSLRMDQGADLDTNESDVVRKDEDDESDIQKTAQKKGVRSNTMQEKARVKKKRRTLPPVLQGLMGEANLRFARGETELAARMCMEIIRQVPSAPEPFHTLAMIYETDQPEKSLQFALIAAHLSPKDSEQWLRLGNLSLESGDIKQAITCYSKAIQANPKDAHVYDIRAQLQEQIGDKKGYLKGYTKLIQQLDHDDFENIMKYAKMLAKRYMQENNSEQALEAMENIFKKCPDYITLEEVNIMTEILIARKHFNRCLEILTKYTRIWVKYKQAPEATASKINEETSKKEEKIPQMDVSYIGDIEACDIPDDVAVDLKAKFLITIIELNHIEIADQLLPKFYTNENPEISGDLFLDVAEALMGKKEFKRALVLLDPLVNSENFSLAAVWLRHAECWVGCKDLKKAIKSYEIVRKLSPQHLGAKCALAKLYQLKGQYNKAIDVLYQDPETDTLDPEIIYRRTILLFKVRRYDEGLQSGTLLFSRHSVYLRNKEELDAIGKSTGTRVRLETLQLHRLTRGEKFEEENAPVFLKSTEPSEKKEFLLLLRMCKVAFQIQKYGLLQRICFTALTSRRFEKRNSYLLFLCLLSCIYNNDSFRGYNIVRHLVRISRRSNAWNLLNIIIQKAEDSRHNKFIMRLLGREDVFSYLHVMHANNCLVSGTYKYALNDYVSLFRVAPTALLGLLIAVTSLQMASQKFSAKKGQLIVQAIAFMQKYSELRGEDGRQEANYNTGRLFHQVGLLPAAMHYYNLVLREESPDLVKQFPHLLDLKRQAAFNLHLIYLQSENYLMAKRCIEEYITI